MALQEAECSSVYFLLKLLGGCGPGHALYEVKIQGGKVMGKAGEFLDPVSKFFDRSDPDVPNVYRLGATRFGGLSKLYLLQHEGYSNWWIKGSSTRTYDLYKGCIFDIMTKELMPFKRPNQIKKAALLISAYGKLYHLAHPSSYMSLYGMPDPSFEVYDPDTGSWSRCSTFPRYHMNWCKCELSGYAVCYGCILVSVGGLEKGELWVYQVTLDQWKEVNIPTDDFGFQGRAVAVDNTIYASSATETVIAFSLIREDMADGSIEYSVDKPCQLHGLRTCFHMDSDCYRTSEYLIHMGGLNFCLLQTVIRDFSSQRVWITTFDIIFKQGKRRIRTLDSIMRKVDIEGLGQFDLESGFTLECEEGKEIASTTFLMQPDDASRLDVLEKATLKKMKKQIRKRRWKTMKFRSWQLTLLGNMFRPCRQPNYDDYVEKLITHPHAMDCSKCMEYFHKIQLANEKGFLQTCLEEVTADDKFDKYKKWIETIQSKSGQHLKIKLPKNVGEETKGKYRNENVNTLVIFLRNINEHRHIQNDQVTTNTNETSEEIAQHYKEVYAEVQELFPGFLSLLHEELQLYPKYYWVFQFH